MRHSNGLLDQGRVSCDQLCSTLAAERRRRATAKPANPASTTAPAAGSGTVDSFKASKFNDRDVPLALLGLMFRDSVTLKELDAVVNGVELPTMVCSDVLLLAASASVNVPTPVPDVKAALA